MLASGHTWLRPLGTWQSAVPLCTWQAVPWPVVWSLCTCAVPRSFKRRSSAYSFLFFLFSLTPVSLSLSLFALCLSALPLSLPHYLFSGGLYLFLISLLSPLPSPNKTPTPCKLCLHGMFVPHPPWFEPNPPRSLSHHFITPEIHQLRKQTYFSVLEVLIAFFRMSTS